MVVCFFLFLLYGGVGVLFGVLLFVVLFSGVWSFGYDDLCEWLWVLV